MRIVYSLHVQIVFILHKGYSRIKWDAEMLWVTLHPQKDIEVLSPGTSEHNLTGNYSFCGCKQDKMRSYCRGQGPYSSITDLFLLIYLVVPGLSCSTQGLFFICSMQNL